MLDQASRPTVVAAAPAGPPVHRVGLVCGSGAGTGRHYLDFAAELGGALGRAGFDLVCGGTSAGLLSEVVRAAHTFGSGVLNVVPHALLPEAADDDLSGGVVLQVVRSTYERMRLVHRLSDAVVVLPGGVEVLRELGELLSVEAVTGRVGRIVLANRRGCFDPLLELLDHAEADAFATGAELRMLEVAETADDVLRLLGRPRP
jgi:uncharacterized protein (TIGR00730 family)